MKGIILGGGNELTNLDLSKKILRILNRPVTLIHYVKDRPGHDRRYVLNCSKIKKELGWKSEYNFEDALKETIKWYKRKKQF